MIHITKAAREVCEKCRRFDKGFGFHYEPLGIQQFFCYECFYARLFDCLLAVLAVRSDVGTDVELTKANLADG
jgi:hypothetical protein